MPTPAGRIIQIVNQPMPDGGWVATHEDITDKVEAENAIRKQEEQTRRGPGKYFTGPLHVRCVEAVDHLQQTICRHLRIERGADETRHAVSGNPGIHGRQGNAPERLPAFLKVRLNDVSVNAPYQTINRLRDGRYIAVVHRPLANGGWVATHEDVTEAKRREELFRLLFEGSPVPMWVIDKETLRFLAVNEAAIALYGYSRTQFMSMTLTELRPPEDRARFAAFIHSLADDQFIENIGQHIKADGTQVDVAVHSKALTYEGRNARLTVVHDITKTKHAEGELRRTKIFLNAVIEHVPVPIVVQGPG